MFLHFITLLLRHPAGELLVFLERLMMSYGISPRALCLGSSLLAQKAVAQSFQLTRALKLKYFETQQMLQHMSRIESCLQVPKTFKNHLGGLDHKNIS